MVTHAPTVTRTPGTAVDAPPTAGKRRRRTATAAAPLGSLLQVGVERPVCPECGGDQVTVLSMVLTDGTAVRFSSCRGCEHRRWDAEDQVLSITEVLERTRG